MGDAPNGYTFVPVGQPELTEQCRELSRKQGLEVFIVDKQNAKHAARESSGPQEQEHLRHHVNRVGYHFPNRVVDQALAKMGMGHLKPGAGAQPMPVSFPGSSALEKHIVAQSRIAAAGAKTALSKAQYRHAVGAAIKELFPLIPDEDRAEVVERAFAEHSATVGNSDLPMARKVQLAVGAHIRHVYTDYDGLIRPFGWQGARNMVETTCLEKIKAWRGERNDDDDDSVVEMEQIMREIIVLEDDSDEGEGQPPRTRPNAAVDADADQRLEPSGSSAGASRPRRKRNRSESGEVVEESRTGSQPEDLSRRSRTRLNGQLSGHQATAVSEPPVIRPSTAQLAQPRPVRGSRPAEINHLDEMSQRFSPATPYQPEPQAPSSRLRPQGEAMQRQHSYSKAPHGYVTLQHREQRRDLPLPAHRIRAYAQAVQSHEPYALYEEHGPPRVRHEPPSTTVYGEPEERRRAQPVVRRARPEYSDWMAADEAYMSHDEHGPPRVSCNFPAAAMYEDSEGRRYAQPTARRPKAEYYDLTMLDD